MEKETNSLIEVSASESNQIKEIPSLWRWYFGWHPRIFLTAPLFLIFVYSGFWFIVTEVKDIIFFFHNTPVTWGGIFLIAILGTVGIWFFLAPIYISFLSISWLYDINIGDNSAWKKFLSSIGIVYWLPSGQRLYEISQHGYLAFFNFLEVLMRLNYEFYNFYSGMDDWFVCFFIYYCTNFNNFYFFDTIIVISKKTG